MCRSSRRPAAGKTSVALILLIFLLGIAAGGITLRLLRPGAHPTPVAPVGPSASAPADTGAPVVPPAGGETPTELDATRKTAVVRAAERVGPAVVSISVTQIRYVRESPFAQNPDPFNRFFDRFFPGRVYGEEISSLGSGIIIDSRGIVVTNEHVVRDAKEIKVSLPDGRTFDGTLVSSDRAYDLAVLRIPAENLPTAPVGTADDLMVGEWAIALGNPFGFLLNDYQPTVTVGVISATNREIKPEQEGEAIYKNMIQTDAAINPGNSGGPLVNALGQVIGINTFIFSTSGGNLGIGFAIPIDTVVRVVREILEYGRVRQVWIGIRVQEISQMVANYFRIRDRRGLLVWGIEEGSPADRAGVRPSRAPSTRSD
jgi:serine protease Do